MHTLGAFSAALAGPLGAPTGSLPLFIGVVASGPFPMTPENGPRYMIHDAG